MLDELLPYYENELTYLRRLSKEFASKYPKIASRLQMEGEVCEDPHVERLIESFSFLTARIHKKLDDEFPQITEAMLSVLYPHFLRPVPSMSIAQLQLAPGAEISTMQELPRHSQLLTRPVQGLPIRYRTGYPVDVWPIRIADARLEAAERSAFAVTRTDTVATLRLRIEPTAQLPLSKLPIQRLRLYLDGESPLVHALHELLLNATASITLRAPDDAPQVPPLRLPPSALKPVGFEEEDALLDYDPRSFLGYRLIQEYFVLPEKFLFIDVTGLDLSRFDGAMEIAIELGAFGRPERLQRLEQTVTADTFRLFCTPIVNLFKQQGEPIRLSQERHEYQVVPDVRRPLGLEVYSVDWVRKFSRTPTGNDSVEFYPAYSVQHGLHDDGSGHYWYLQRRPSLLPNDDGSDVMLSLVDREMNPRTPVGGDTVGEPDLHQPRPALGLALRRRREPAATRTRRRHRQRAAAQEAQRDLARTDAPGQPVAADFAPLAQPPVDRRWWPRGPAGNPQPLQLRGLQHPAQADRRHHPRRRQALHDAGRPGARARPSCAAPRSNWSSTRTSTLVPACT
jgi:type VI secretion system protein ImpG